MKYDPAAAKKLLADAGYGPGKPVKVKVQISASGSGQMQPVAMNEYIQQSLKECGVNVEFDVIVWETLFNNWRARREGRGGARRARDQRQLRLAGSVLRLRARFYDSRMVAPRSVNWGWVQSPEFDKLRRQRARLSSTRSSATLRSPSCTSVRSRSRSSSSGSTTPGRAR